MYLLLDAFRTNNKLNKMNWTVSELTYQKYYADFVWLNYYLLETGTGAIGWKSRSEQVL